MSDPSFDVFDIIAEEVRVSKDEIYDADSFSELGVDDVLSKSITDRVKEKLSLDLPRTILQDGSNADTLQTYLRAHHTSEPSTSPKPYVQLNAKPSNHAAKAPIKSKGPLSILLQGKPASARNIVFLLPDGSGSGMVYSQLPQIAPSVCVYAMNSPFLSDHGKDSAIYETSIEDLALLWVQEIRLRQPHGPYILGGYSAGGYYSFEVAKELMKEGEEVEKLVLIDSPCRTNFEALPMEVIHYLVDNKLLGNWGAGKKTPDWFVRHFDGAINAVERYQPAAITARETGGKAMPKCFVIWAAKGVLDGTGITPAETGLDLNVKITKFMLEDKKKTGFGFHGWDTLLPGAMMAVTQMTGNHFSLVHPPNVSLFLPSLRYSMRLSLIICVVQHV